MRHLLEGSQCQRYRLGYALDCQITIDCNGFIAFEFYLCGFEGYGRVFRGVKVIGTLKQFIKQGKSGVNRFGINDDIYRGGLGSAIIDDFPAGFVEAMNLVGIAKVIVFKPRLCVV